MVYTCDDFKQLKFEKGMQCSVGNFGNDIYAMKCFIADGHNSYHNEYYKITEEEFIKYPNNGEELIDKYYKGHSVFLCSDYLGKGHSTYSFEKE